MQIAKQFMRNLQTTQKICLRNQGCKRFALKKLFHFQRLLASKCQNDTKKRLLLELISLEVGQTQFLNETQKKVVQYARNRKTLELLKNRETRKKQFLAFVVNHN